MDAKTTLYNAYSEKNAADAYILGFIQRKTVYMFHADRIPMKWVNLTRESSSRGGAAKLRLYIPSADCKELVANGTAVAIGTLEDLQADSRYNQGDNFEKLIVEKLTGNAWKKNSDKFDTAGDVTINGKQIQIKLNRGSIVTAKGLGITVEA